MFYVVPVGERAIDFRDPPKEPISPGHAVDHGWRIDPPTLEGYPEGVGWVFPSKHTDEGVLGG